MMLAVALIIGFTLFALAFVVAGKLITALEGQPEKPARGPASTDREAGDAAEGDANPRV